MRIFFYELRKIFTVGMIALLAVASVIFYFLFLSFEFDHFPNGRPERDIFKITVEEITEHGPTMDEQQLAKFRERYDKQVEEANRFLQTRPEFVSAGITTYQAFQEIGLERKDMQKLRNQVIFDEEVDIFWELQAREFIIDRYLNKESWLEGRGENEEQRARGHEIYLSGEADSILPWFVWRNYNQLIVFESILITLSVLLMLTPYYLKERRNRMFDLQYSTRTGRTLFRTKWLAGCTAALLFTTLHLGCFFALYSMNETAPFWQAGINSVLNDYASWFDLTFGAYIGITIVAIFVLALFTSVIALFVSRLAPSYFAAVGIQVPFAFVLWSLLLEYLLHDISSIRQSTYLLIIAYALLVTSAIVITALRWRRERVTDIHAA